MADDHDSPPADQPVMYLPGPGQVPAPPRWLTEFAPPPGFCSPGCVPAPAPAAPPTVWPAVRHGTYD